MNPAETTDAEVSVTVTHGPLIADTTLADPRTAQVSVEIGYLIEVVGDARLCVRHYPGACEDGLKKDDNYSGSSMTAWRKTSKTSRTTARKTIWSRRLKKRRNRPINRDSVAGAARLNPGCAPDRHAADRMPGADPPPAEYDAGSVVADMDLDRFMELAEAFVDRIPEKLLEGLNGGIHVVEEAQWREGDPPGVAVLGEYVTDPHLGASIVLYYGSFIELFGDDEAQIEAELWETIRHEVRHHVEAWAGVDDLDREDAEELSRFFQEAYENGSAPAVKIGPPTKTSTAPAIWTNTKTAITTKPKTLKITK